MPDGLEKRKSLAAPQPLSPMVREQMQRMPSRNTKPELLVRSELFNRGLRFRVNVRSLPGSPDIVFTRVKIAVFIDGCYWHGCPVHKRAPVHNREWWVEKISRNQKRDRRNQNDLEAAGWWVLRYWEHDDIDDVADEIEWLWRDLRSGMEETGARKKTPLRDRRGVKPGAPERARR